MDAARWQKVSDLMERAQPLTRRSRRALLERECGGDAELQSEVESLLDADASATGFLSESVGAAAIKRLAPLQRLSMEGRTLAGFRILRVVGHGGMGIVYEAEQQSPRRRVALKLLESGLGSSGKRGFQSEAQVLARLQHESIARVHAAGVEELALPDGGSRAVAWIAMEYIEDARTIVAAAKDLPLARRLELGLQACDAIHHGHDRGVIHRDIKPSNVIVGIEGRAKVIDFGVARAIDAAESLHSRQGDLIGTLQYMSPEQVEGRVADIDVRTDVYGLGLLLYELCTFEKPLPVAEMTLPQAARVICEDAPPAPHERHPGFPRELGWILLKALEKEKSRRYAGADDLAADLRRYLAGEAVLAAPPDWTYRLRKHVRKHRVAWAAGTATGAALVLGMIGTAAGLLRARDAEREAREAAAASRTAELVAEQRLGETQAAQAEVELRNYLAGINAADGALAGGAAHRALQQLDRLPAARRGWEWHALRGEADRSSRGYSLGDDGWSGADADARQTRFVWSDTYEARIYDDLGRQLYCVLPPEGVWRTRMSPDGRRCALATRTGLVLVLELADGSLRRLPVGPDWTPAELAAEAFAKASGTPPPWPKTAKTFVTEAAWLDESTLVVALAQRGLYKLDVESGRTELLRDLRKPQWSAIFAVSPVGDQLAYVADEELLVAPVSGGEAVVARRHRRDWAGKTVAALSFDASGRHLVVADYVDGLGVLDLATFEWRPIDLGSSKREVLGVHRHPDPDLMVLTGFFPSPVVVSISKAAVAGRINGARSSVVGAHASAAGLWTFAFDGEARFYDWSEAAGPRRMAATHGVEGLAVHPQGPLALTMGEGLQLHDLERFATLWSHHETNVRYSRGAFAGDGSRFFAAPSTGGVEVWSLSGPRRVAHVLRGLNVQQLEAHPSLPLLGIRGWWSDGVPGRRPGSGGDTLLVYDWERGVVAQELAHGRGKLQSFCFADGGREVVCAGGGLVARRSLEDGRVLASFGDLEEQNDAVAVLDTDGSVLVSEGAGWGSMTRRFDRELRAQARVVLPMQRFTNAIVPVPGSRRAVIGGQDDIYRVYDLDTGAQTLGIAGQTNHATTLAWCTSMEALVAPYERDGLQLVCALPPQVRARKRAEWEGRLERARREHAGLLDGGMDASDFELALAQRAIPDARDRLALQMLHMQAASVRR